MAKVKICGITNFEDANNAYLFGADIVGFIFIEESLRSVGVDIVKRIVSSLPVEMGKAGLFHDRPMEEVIRCVDMCGLNYVQLHGNESVKYCNLLRESLSKEIKIIKTFKIERGKITGTLENYTDIDYYLFDTLTPGLLGGTSQTFDWNILKEKKFDKPFFVAGGLKPDNVSKAILTAHPFGVDVSSGVEAFVGKKNKVKMKEFIENAKKY
ncbi:N-(5'-phosphoribosyl)anthranilate isomerase [Candidatus Omnitrophus magneticus]|uniref:N-(5'-phosphoribosyl)anthranilate isomerase n=1 Tax=Candidatus Omnitrophus magneticus TaxID=1609969 RepID=A0A0F0CNZ1_9BACT|nr:N-(5'-phosphoribosyl)anthranilate isomerase [Candidatus Omnitrophus magneticus]